jgi:hypothetical protein
MTHRLIEGRGSWPARFGSSVAAVALGITACAGINSQTNSFATLDEARQAGAIAKGWIPEGLPAGTHDIREAHLPGTERRWGIINFPQSDADTLRALLRDELSLQGQRCKMPKRIEWWPIEMRGELNADRLAATGIRGYRAKAGGLLFAVNWKQGRAYYWAGSGPASTR